MNSIFSLLFIFIYSYSWSQTSKPVLKKYPKEVQKIIYLEKGVFRGSNFGETKNAVKSKETEAIQAETDSSLTYTLNIDSDDSADLIYYLDSTGRAKSFAIIFILQDVKEEKKSKDKFNQIL